VRFFFRSTIRPMLSVRRFSVPFPHPCKFFPLNLSLTHLVCKYPSPSLPIGKLTLFGGDFPRCIPICDPIWVFSLLRSSTFDPEVERRHCTIFFISVHPCSLPDVLFYIVNSVLFCHATDSSDSPRFRLAISLLSRPVLHGTFFSHTFMQPGWDAPIQFCSLFPFPLVTAWKFPPLHEFFLSPAPCFVWPPHPPRKFSHFHLFLLRRIVFT